MATVKQNQEPGGRKLSALGDLIFHKTFASVENKDILAGLARDFYGIEPKEITILDPYDIKVYAERNKDETPENKVRHTRKDIKARLETADLTIELQVWKDSLFIQRTIKYLCDTYTGNYNEALREGLDLAAGHPDAAFREDRDAAVLSRYASLRPVYALNIVNYIMFPDDLPLRVFRFYDDVRQKALDRDWLKIAYFELTKPQVETERQLYWRDYFLGNPLSEKAPGYIRKAAELLDYANLTQEERRMLDRDEYAQSAYESELYTARCIGLDEGRAEGLDIGRAEGLDIGRAEGFDIGRREGREEGREAERLANAARMKADGMEPVLIAKYTGLSMEEIAKL